MINIVMGGGGKAGTVPTVLTRIVVLAVIQVIQFATGYFIPKRYIRGEMYLAQ